MDKRPVKVAGGQRPDLNGPVRHPHRPLTEAEKGLPIAALLDSRRPDHPDAATVIEPGARGRGERVLDRSLALAARLHRLAGAAREPVVLLAMRGSNQIAAMLACLRLGLPYVPLDPRHSPLRHRQVVVRSGAQIVLCERETKALAAAIGRDKPVLAVDDPGDAADGPLPAMPDADAVAMLLFTSGSTGMPKGVAHTQRSLLSSSATAIEMLHISAEDRLVVVGGLAVITSGSRLLAGAIAGATLLPVQGGIAVPAFLEFCARHGATVLSCYVGFVRAIAAHPKAAEALRTIRAVIVFGDVSLWEDIAAMRRMLPADAHICILYGSTESDLTTAWFVPRAAAQDSARVPIGYPLPGSDLWIDPWEEVATDGSQVGELLAGGERLALGYWRDPGLTEAAFVPHPADSGKRTYRTGDLVRLRADGLIEYVGRRDNQVKVRGWRVELEDIESVAKRIPGVGGAGVVARRNPAGIVESLALYLEPDAGTQLATEDAMARIRKALPRHMWPVEILLAQELPRTDTVKLDRARLAEIDARRRDQRSESLKDDGAPSHWKDELPRRIAGLIASNLKLKVMGPQDNFIDLGGDSLEALSIAVNIEKTFGVTIDPSELLEAPTVGATIEKVATMARANR